MNYLEELICSSCSIAALKRIVSALAPAPTTAKKTVNLVNLTFLLRNHFSKSIDLGNDYFIQTLLS
jgi:hypothetical protein